MHRRSFLSLSAAAGLAGLAPVGTCAAEDSAARFPSPSPLRLGEEQSDLKITAIRAVELVPIRPLPKYQPAPGYWNTTDVEIAGYPIRKGDLACFSIGSANRDESHYADPDRFDLHRANKADMLSFGLGAHYCLGSHLARMEARIALSALFDRLPNLRLDPAASSRIIGFAFRSPDRLPVLFG